MRRVALVLVGGVLLAAPASASALSVSRAELKSGSLRVEGSGAAAGAQVTVTSTTSSAASNASASGAFRVEASGFRSDSCKVTIADGGRTASVVATRRTPRAPSPSARSRSR